MKTIGLIAGNGRFPIIVAKEAKKQGYKVVVCAIVKETHEALERVADVYEWVKLGEIKKLVKFFKKNNVTQVVMAGKVEKVRLFQENIKPDLDMVKVLLKTKDFKDDSLLGSVADYLAEHGLELMDSTLFLGEQLPGSGILGRRKPSKQVVDDIEFGYQMAKSIAGLDLGQTVVVKKKAVLAVEAIEGTDEAILRGGKLGGDKVTVVKVSKPNQDMRFDVPVVGLRTMERLIEIKAEAFAFEAGKTIFMDQEDFIDRANRHKIAVVGV